MVLVTKKRFFLPWQNFNGNTSNLYNPSVKAFDIASKLHPAWFNCKQAVQRLYARNVHQILGRDLKMSVDFVICWTSKGKLIGGTSLAIRIALKEKIEIFKFSK